MRVEYDGTVWCGRAIDLSVNEFDGGQLISAMGCDGDVGGLRVVCATPGVLHGHVGRVASGMALRTQTALAVAARSRGLTAPQDEEYRRLQKQIEERSIAVIDTAGAHKRLAEVTDEIERQRERVARLQGRVNALRERTDHSEGETTRALERAIRRLSEFETERAAAEQALERARRRQRRLYDRHDERLTLEDRAANLARAARKHLCDRIEFEFERALAAVPEPTATPDDAVTAALAIAKVGRLTAPIVLECNRFDTATAAANWLDSPVISL